MCVTEIVYTFTYPPHFFFFVPTPHLTTKQFDELLAMLWMLVQVHLTWVHCGVVTQVHDYKQDQANSSRSASAGCNSIPSGTIRPGRCNLVF